MISYKISMQEYDEREKAQPEPFNVEVHPTPTSIPCSHHSIHIRSVAFYFHSVSLRRVIGDQFAVGRTGCHYNCWLVMVLPVPERGPHTYNHI